MGLFFKKKAAAAAAETKTEQSPRQPYRHVPQHAATDSMLQGGQNSGSHFDRERVIMESRRRMKFAAANELNAGDAAYMQALARGALPRSPYGQIRSAGSRTGSGYFTPSMPYIEDVEDPSQVDDKSRTEPNWSNDSGYISANSSLAIHSRTPSEHGKLELENVELSQPTKQIDLGTSLGDVAVAEPELSEASSDDAGPEMRQQKSRRGVLKVRRTSHSPDDDTRSTKSAASVRSVGKHTRFEHSDETVPDVPSQYRAKVAKPETRLQNRERVLRTPSPDASGKISTEGSTSTLDGYRVNTRGQVLDEEGELIGELVDGELIDCVRQKINSSGHVVDATNTVVGRVRSITHAPDGGKVYVRPTMSPVPENKNSPDLGESSKSYSYKGEIPATDGFVGHSRTMSLNSRVLPPALNRHMTTGMLAMNSSQFNPTAGRRSVAYAVGVPGPRPTVNTRHSYSAPMRRSPLASQDHSPLGIDEGEAAGDNRNIPEPRPEILRSASTRTMTSVRTAHTMTGVNKQKTYFTHAGRITVEANSLTSETDKDVPAATEADGKKASANEKGVKHKSRISGLFSRKKAAAVA